MRPDVLSKTSPVYGDRALAEQFLELTPSTPALFGAAVTVVGPHVPGGASLCGIGVPTDRTFLLGSIGKALNGLIYSGMVADGTVRPQDTLDTFLPVQRTAAGVATLESLLTHTSGLPCTGGGRRHVLRMNWRILRSRDPQPEGLDHLIDQLRTCRTTPGAFHYSNLGGSALGHALAAAAGMSYPQLVAERLARPLGCPTMYVPEPGAGNDPRDAPGLSVFNRRQEPWTGEGYAPAGGIRASADDLAVLLDALVNNPLPGWEDVFRPLARVDEENSIGAGWIIPDTPDGLVWHNGYAGGFGSAIVLDRKAGRGAAVSVIDGTMTADPVPAALALSHGEEV